MEQVMDVSWMTHGKDRLGKHSTKWNSLSQASETSVPPVQPLESSTPSTVNGNSTSGAGAPSPAQSSQSPTPPKPIPERAGTYEEKRPTSANGTSPGRRGSWFSKISSQFSSTPGATPPPAAASPQPTSDDVSPLPKINPNKNAVLPHATRQSGEGPYVPAPPRSAQPGFLGVLRRLSSSNGSLAAGKNHHGLVERKVLNVDKKRERPRLNDLNPSKLRRVAFCVDVEIAPMPKYAGSETVCKGSADKDKTQKLKSTEKSEGDALKRPKTAEEQKEATGEDLPKQTEKQENATTNGAPKANGQESTDEPKPEKEVSRKKEKKKKSEAERKAKKEQKLKEALEKGAIPMEIHLDSDSSSEEATAPKGAHKPQVIPTTNPARIYRRCCQLRETDILTKITTQLPKTTDGCGVVERLDLTGYFMSLPDLVTLGDFLAVVPVKEVILENCGLTDEGVRVVLAGLLASRKPNTRQRRSITKAADLTQQGGVVEGLVLKNNKLGVEGWKHICLFIHMCRSIKCLDLSSIAFPALSEPPKTPLSQHLHFHNGHNPVAPVDLSILLSKALGERLAGSELELLNIGETGITTSQLGNIIDGALKSGISRIGLANNDLDIQGLEQVAKYLRGGKCQGIDLGGNDLRDHLEVIADAVDENDATFWALSLADCNLKPGSLCKLFPKLTQLKNFRFIDLSHNTDLCESDPSAIGLLRRYLPNMESLRRLHLADVAMSSEQAIALAEILPEIKTLAHINLLENPRMVNLADAKTEETQEEACALYASLLAASRVSDTLVKIDIDYPSAESGEIIKALANQVVAYCLRNMRMAPDLLDSASGEQVPRHIRYPDVLRHLVGHEEDSSNVESDDDDVSVGPDEDYVIGGTGVVKALACCLENRGDDSGRQSGEFVRDLEITPTTPVSSGKAKDMSKNLLASARKIRIRLQPALVKAKASSREDINTYTRLVFLDQTISGIINRFEDEYPETRLLITPPHAAALVPELGTSLSSTEGDDAVFLSDTEELETELRPPSRSRSNSMVSTSKALAEEEGHALRVGHKFRRGFLREEHNEIFTNPEYFIDPDHVRSLEGVVDDIATEDEDIRKKTEELGAMRTFQENKEDIMKRLRDKDPVYWDRFIESQHKARANVLVDVNGAKEDTPPAKLADESAIAD
ncbi:uncharacterized protein BCR38DRAFT_482177 [Pseudomassariella vexata]|uniref:Cell wall biogenesis protein Mhp1 n=1 Tax=Pseudomassariella vexata TaxID=1141098 RepID=A0A1Y2EBK3_9PEZI|nr:uncharacterized protein BCR38DRAFT_482177 [Pseudomassariella vexata]ORY68684.1 hypothetical protein BCR38DRAFT_482177 [Pseudomassariella vexata]